MIVCWTAVRDKPHVNFPNYLILYAFQMLAFLKQLRRVVLNKVLLLAFVTCDLILKCRLQDYSSDIRREWHHFGMHNLITNNYYILVR